MKERINLFILGHREMRTVAGGALPADTDKDTDIIDSDYNGDMAVDYYRKPRTGKPITIKA